MRLSTLANLVLVRNHLLGVINSTKVDKNIRNIVSKMDTAFLNGVQQLDLNNVAGDCVSSNPQEVQATTVVLGREIVACPTEQSVEVSSAAETEIRQALEKVTSNKGFVKYGNESPQVEDDEISKKVAEAKKSVGGRKGKATIKRSSEE